MTGTVKTLNKDKMFGFIKSDEDGNDYFFHASGLVGWDWNEVEKGHVVEFEPTNSNKGLRAESVMRI